jgi:imidazolonepropionase-like amidohydrolase
VADSFWRIGTGLPKVLARWSGPCAAIAALALVISPAYAAKPTKPLAIKAGRILTVTKGIIENGVIVVRDGKIAAIGKQGEVAIPADAEVMDVSDRWVMPGQVDLHAHIGNDSGLHDYVHTLNPELRVWDYLDPEAPQVHDNIASGVTTIMTIPGSGGNHSGFGVVWKLGGAPRDELIIRRLGGMKVAQAYNPERRAGDLGESRMGMWWMLRELFTRAQKYNADWTDFEGAKGQAAADGRRVQVASNGRPVVSNAKPGAAKPKAPAFKPGLENMRSVFQKKTPVFVHTASGRDVFQTMLMFHDLFRLPVVISHGEFGAFRVAQEAAKRGIPCNIGPRLYDFGGQVYDRKFYSIPGEYARAGVKNVSLNTDCPVIPGEELYLQGTLSVRLGMDEDMALRALTINPATAIGVADRVGSLEVGKDADLVIKKGSLFDPRNPIERVLISGNTVYTHGQKRKGYSSAIKAMQAMRDDDGCLDIHPEDTDRGHDGHHHDR